MTAIEALEKISEYINEKREEVYNEIGYANQHKFRMESQALQYKVDVYNDINGEILMLIHELNNAEEVEEETIKPRLGWPPVTNCPKNCKICQAKCLYRKEKYNDYVSPKD